MVNQYYSSWGLEISRKTIFKQLKNQTKIKSSYLKTKKNKKPIGSNKEFKEENEAINEPASNVYQDDHHDPNKLGTNLGEKIDKSVRLLVKYEKKWLKFDRQ